jgi:hypothetical protein
VSTHPEASTSSAGAGDGQSGTGAGSSGGGGTGSGGGQVKPTKTSLIHELSVSGDPEALITVTLQQPPGGVLPKGLQLNCSGQATVYWPNGDRVTAPHVTGSVSAERVDVSIDVQNPRTDDDPVSGKWDLTCNGNDPSHPGQVWQGHATGCTGRDTCPPAATNAPASPTPRKSGGTPASTPTPGKSGGSPSPTRSAT